MLIPIAIGALITGLFLAGGIMAATRRQAAVGNAGHQQQVPGHQAPAPAPQPAPGPQAPQQPQAPGHQAPVPAAHHPIRWGRWITLFILLGLIGAGAWTWFAQPQWLVDIMARTQAGSPPAPPVAAPPAPQPVCTAYDRRMGNCGATPGVAPQTTRPVPQRTAQTFNLQSNCGEIRREVTLYPGDVLINFGNCGYRRVSVSDEATFTRMSCTRGTIRSGCASLTDSSKKIDEVRIVPGQEMSLLTYGTVTHFRSGPSGRPVTIVIEGTFR